MNHKKYLILILIIMTFGINRIYAEDNYNINYSVFALDQNLTAKKLIVTNVSKESTTMKINNQKNEIITDSLNKPKYASQIAYSNNSNSINQNNKSSNKVDTSCDGIFGKKDDPNSLRYSINEILTYPRIIVPILVIGLGTLDFAKAVIASKEDEMKKAQRTFIKRVLIGITIFLVPVIMNIIMYLADIVWNGGFTTCGL